MAVTVTPTAVASTTPKEYVGVYGTIGANVSSGVTAPFASKRIRATRLVLSGTYATGGFALSPAAYGLKEIYALAVIADGTSGGVATPYLFTTGASPVVKLVTDNVPTELANATSVTNNTFAVLLVGV